jgi:hypothetical protein
MNQHLKGRIKKFFTTIITLHSISSSSSSTDPEPCDCKPLLSIAAHVLDTHLVPALERSLDNNEEYWSLKDRSPLRAYFDSHPLKSRRPADFFTPANLLEILKDHFWIHDLFEPGNGDIVRVGDSPFKQCFQTPTIYVPDLYNLCLPHVNIVQHHETRQQLKHAAVKQELYVEIPASILYQDPSARFWLPPVFNQIICRNTDISYPWEELRRLFTAFFTAPNEHITRLDTEMYAILPTSELADFFHFKHIHHDQVLVLIKHLTKYLGKTSTMLTLCPKLKFTQCKPSDPVIFWIENLIAANHKHGSPNTLRLTLE